MALRPYYFVVSIVALILVCVQINTAQTSQDSNKDETAIRQVVQQVQDGWNAHDGKAFALPFAPNADYVVVNGRRISGRDAIEKGHIAIFTTLYKESRNTATIRSIRFLRPDVAVVHIEWNLEFQVNDKTEKAQAINTMVMTKEGGEWTIGAFQNTPIQSRMP